MYYIRLPRSDLDLELKNNSFVSRLDITRGDVLDFGVYGEFGLAFNYIFAKTMSVVEVKSNNTTDRQRALLVEEAKLTGKTDKAYLDNLKNAVRYWDGKE